MSCLVEEEPFPITSPHKFTCILYVFLFIADSNFRLIHLFPLYICRVSFSHCELPMIGKCLDSLFRQKWKHSSDAKMFTCSLYVNILRYTLSESGNGTQLILLWVTLLVEVNCIVKTPLSSLTPRAMMAGLDSRKIPPGVKQSLSLVLVVFLLMFWCGEAKEDNDLVKFRVIWLFLSEKVSQNIQIEKHNLVHINTKLCRLFFSNNF